MNSNRWREIVYLKWQEQGGVCGGRDCDTPIDLDDPQAERPQLAHRIPKTKANIKKWGLEVLDHPINLVLVTNLKCNDSVLVGAARPMEQAAIIAEIRADLEEA